MARKIVDDLLRVNGYAVIARRRSRRGNPGCLDRRAPAGLAMTNGNPHGMTNRSEVPLAPDGLPSLRGGVADAAIQGLAPCPSGLVMTDLAVVPLTFGGVSHK